MGMGTITRNILPVGLLLALVTTIQADDTLRGYDCSDAITIRKSQLSQVLPSCGKTKNIDIKTIDATLLKKNPVIKPILVHRCNVIYKLSKSDSFVASIVHSLGHEILGRTACLDAHTSRTLTILGQPIRGLTTHNLVHQRLRIDKDPACSLFGGTIECEQIEKDYEIGLSTSWEVVNFEEDRVHFENGLVCNYSDLGCIDNRYGEFYWEKMDENEDECNPSYFSSIFNGRFNIISFKSSISRHLFEYAESQIGDYKFAVKIIGSLTICSQPAYTTEHPNLFILIDGLNSYEKRSISLKEINDFDKAGIFYNETKAEKRCKIEKQCFIERIQVLNENPNKFSEDFPAGMIVSVAQDEKVTVKRCSSISVTRRKCDGRYSEEAVLDNLGRKWFLTPDSNILINHADPVLSKSWFEELDKFIGLQLAKFEILSYVLGRLVGMVWGFAVIVRLCKLFIKPIFKTLFPRFDLEGGHQRVAVQALLLLRLVDRF